MRREDVEQIVVIRFEQGSSPSEIDRAMRLPAGTARSVIRRFWASGGAGSRSTDDPPTGRAGLR